MATTMTLANGAILRATFAPTAAFRRARRVAGSLTTVEKPVELDETGKAAVITTAHGAGRGCRPTPRPIRWAAAWSCCPIPTGA